MTTAKCSIIQADVYAPHSQVVVLATQNQFLWDYQRDNDNSAISAGEIETAQSIVNSQVAVVNGQYASKYGNIDNITWSDFTSCKSMNAVTDSSGNPVLDSSGNLQYKNFDRQSMADLSYKPHTKYLASVRPLTTNSVMQKMCTFVPIHLDEYYPPEVVVLFVLFISMIIIGILMWVLLSGDDSDEQTHSRDHPYYQYGYQYGYGYPNPSSYQNSI